VFESILIATDGSRTASQAVDAGAEMARKTGARVHVVTAYHPLPGPKVSGGRAVDPELSAWQLRSDSKAETVLDQACAAARIKGVDAEPHARKGDPADAILGMAEELGSDLIVVGNKGLSGARRFLLGSVPDKVSHHAPCSVMIVHTT
jgi:nucleotide-binding universal stress UspA family protein